MIGKVLGNRYELLQKIGGGGMAVVYKARCKLLNRLVAVKILKPEFTNDDNFLKRFLNEAQSAASLSHPNIVSIYDVGHEDDIHYIVMELVDGITLKQHIVNNTCLPWREAVGIAIQVCSAISHAHKNKIIHRDIKPHNILITREKVAKVADFGIARAVTTSTLTSAGNVFGSVHYSSPEQARGKYIDEKSDIYSLGVTLYEMITGRLPFDGDTPVTVALKHIQERAQEPIELEKDIPESVNNIILKAMEKDQTKRYQSAKEMLIDLEGVLKEPDRNISMNDSLVDNPTIAFKPIDNENIIPEDELTMSSKTKDKELTGGNTLTVWFALATSFIIILIFGYITYKLVAPSINLKPDDFVVGNYIGRYIGEVENELEEARIDMQVKRVYNDKFDKDKIVEQSIEPDKTLTPGGFSVIVLTVSDGPHMVEVPDVTNKDYRKAQEELQNLGLYPVTQPMSHDTVPIGAVIETSLEPGSLVKVGTAIVIYRSTGPDYKSTVVPNLIGKTWEEAVGLIEAANLTIGKIYPEGGGNHYKIVKQEPVASDIVDEGTPVDLYFENAQEARKLKSIKIILLDDKKYGDEIMVVVIVTPSDTQQSETLINEYRKKSDFPLNLSIPIPVGGETKLYTKLDNEEPIEQTYADDQGR